MKIKPAWLKRWQEHRRAVLVLPEVPGVDPNDPVLSHVDAQIRWYDNNARRTRDWHFRLRTAQIVFAAAIPVTQILPAAVGWRLAAGGLGGLIAICQGVDALHTTETITSPGVPLVNSFSESASSSLLVPPGTPH